MLSLILSPVGFYFLLTLLVIYWIYRFSTRTFFLEQKYGITGPPPLPFVGNSIEFIRKGIHILDVSNQKRYGDIYPLYSGSLPTLVVSDEAVLKQILVKDAKSFIDRPTFGVGSQMMKKNLLRLKGKDWERVRALVTPTFTSGKLKKMSPMIVACMVHLTDQFEKAVGTEVDIKVLFQSLTMDVIAKTMFGIDLDLEHNRHHPFIEHANKLLSFSIRNIFIIIVAVFPSSKYLLEKLFPRGVVSAKSMEFFESSLRKTIELRRNCEGQYHDFLALMLKAHEDLQNEMESNHDWAGENYKGLSEEEIMAQSIVFLLAGFETTASALTFCAYFLTQNQDAQDEIYNELVENNVTEGEITYEALSNLTLVNQCLQESLRICPPASRFQRVCTNDSILTTSSGKVLQVKKGMIFNVPVYAIHHNERLWPDPDKFDIHRFDADQKQSRSQFSFLPFGMGPRSCVGKRFAQLEARLALAYVLRSYKFVPCSQTPETLTFGRSGLTKPERPIIIRIEKR